LASKYRIGILIFNDVEVMDFCGPFEVFSITRDKEGNNAFDVNVIAEKQGPVLARNKLSINPHYSICNYPPLDILLIPGGPGTRKEMHNKTLIEWIKTCSQKTQLVLSVCTGSLLLGKANLLDNIEATTHHGALELLKEVAPKTTVITNQRYIDNGKYITSGGISAGIDMSLYVVSKLLGKVIAEQTAKHMEYNWISD